MARKKKNDFWDDVEDLNTVSDNDQTGDDDTAEVAVDEEWSAVKSLPLKVIMRFLLMVSCLVALVSAYIAYEYGSAFATGTGNGGRSFCDPGRQ